MPVAPTYPGVYIEEVPSGVRTITGVATSITAFIGRALRGPQNRPVTINSYGDFERIFGGLWVDSTLGYAVRDFYQNGGGQAVIVRLFNAAAAASPPARTPLTVATLLTLEAKDPGSWGGNLRAAIDGDVSSTVATSLGVPASALFNLRIVELGPDGTPSRTETFRNVTLVESTRRLDRVLQNESQLVQWKNPFPSPAPNIATQITALGTAQTGLTAALNANPQVPLTIANARKGVAQAQADNISVLERDVDIARATVPLDPTAVQNALTAVANAKATSNGDELTVNDDFTPPNAETNKEGLYALENTDLFNILCIPPFSAATPTVDPALVSSAAAYCEKRRAMFLVDPPATWTTTAQAKSGVGLVGTNSKNAALYFPRLRKPNPLRDNMIEDFVPCGAVAGIFARTDSSRGVWKAPAGLEATLVGVPQLSVPLTDPENGELNPLGINCLRSQGPAGRVVWGARTLQGDDRLASEWKYVPIRRLALFIEESLYRGTQWVVFEPNDEPLWSQIRLNVGAFMHNLFRQGAFQGSTPRDAYLVKVDKETTTQNDINLGIVNIVVGFAPLKPAEFVIIKIQQLAGQIAT
jgi:phage tail sheath protein FI